MATLSKLFCTRSRRTLANCCLLDLVLRQELQNIATRDFVGSNVLIGRFGLITTIRPFCSMQCMP